MLCGGGPLRYFVWPLLIPLLLRIFADEKACPYQPACPSFIPVPFSNQTTTGVLWNGTHVANGTTYTGNATTATDAAQAAQAATIAVHDANDASNSNSTTVGDCSNSGHYNTTTTCQLFNLSNAYTEDWNGGYWFLWSNLLELGYKFTCTSMFFVFFFVARPQCFSFHAQRQPQTLTTTTTTTTFCSAPPTPPNTRYNG